MLLSNHTLYTSYPLQKTCVPIILGGFTKKGVTKICRPIPYPVKSTEIQLSQCVSKSCTKVSKGKSVIKYIHVKVVLFTCADNFFVLFWHCVNPAQNQQQLISFGEIFVPLPGIQNKITIVTKSLGHHSNPSTTKNSNMQYQ